MAITAAHCLENSGFGGGFSFTLTADVSSSAQHPKEILRVHVVHQHPNYNPSGAFARLGEVNDIGLVLLESPVTSIPLETLDGPTRAYMPPGSDLVTAGYGLLSYYATSTAGVKRDAVVQVDRVGAYELQTVPSDPQPCRGDSGGPLFVDAPGGRRLTAIVSRSASNDTFCAHGSIATLVTPYLSWIAEESLDRDTGCSVGHDRSSRSTLLLVILPLVVSRLARRARRAAA